MVRRRGAAGALAERGLGLRRSQAVTYDGAAWAPGVQALGAGRAATVERVDAVVHQPQPGGVSVAAGALPGGALVIGVTARVTTALGGVTGFDLGVAGDAARFGLGVGAAAGSASAGVRAAPQAYPGGGDLVLTALGGAFDGTGELRLAVHLLTLTAPSA